MLAGRGGEVGTSNFEPNLAMRLYLRTAQRFVQRWGRTRGGEENRKEESRARKGVRDKLVARTVGINIVHAQPFEFAALPGILPFHLRPLSFNRGEEPWTTTTTTTIARATCVRPPPHLLRHHRCPPMLPVGRSPARSSSWSPWAERSPSRRKLKWNERETITPRWSDVDANVRRREKGEKGGKEKGGFLSKTKIGGEGKEREREGRICSSGEGRALLPVWRGPIERRR